LPQKKTLYSNCSTLAAATHHVCWIANLFLKILNFDKENVLLWDLMFSFANFILLEKKKFNISTVLKIT
jgi:hypothetical protein